MSGFFPFVHVPADLAKLIGAANAGTRFFRTEGDHAQMRVWFDAVCEHIGPCVSPGGAANYAGVTREGVSNRLRAGRLTAFCFQIVGETKTPFGGRKKLKELPVVFIPVSECQAWRHELETRIKRIERLRGFRQQLSDEEAAAPPTEEVPSKTNPDDAFPYLE